MCSCSDRPEFFDLHPDEALPDFLSDLVREGERHEAGHGLFRCSECNTLWIVDDLSRGPLAVRAASIDDFTHFDEKPYRRSLLIENHGGPGSEECLQAGCKKKALKDIVFCVDHAYPEYTDQRNNA